jgi:transportin-3
VADGQLADNGQIIFDLDQLQRSSLPSLRDSILSLLSTYRSGPRPLRTMLCVCLANLAVQMIEWKDVLPLVASTLGSEADDCILDFLKVLPEETNEGRKINLSVRSNAKSPAVEHKLGATRPRIISV